MSAMMQNDLMRSPYGQPRPQGQPGQMQPGAMRAPGTMPLQQQPGQAQPGAMQNTLARGFQPGLHPQQPTGQMQPGAMQHPAQQPPPQNHPQPNAQQPMPSGTYNPLQPSYMPAPPQGQATMSNANVSPQQSLQMILQGFQPAQQMQTNALNNSLAAAGIQGGGAIDAQTALQRNLAAGLAPSLANAVQGAQGMTLQQSQGNQAAANQMTGTNLEDWMRTNAFNAQAANQAGGTLANMLQQGWQTPLQLFGGLESGGLGAAGGLAGSEANNFPVYQQQSPLSFLGL